MSVNNKELRKFQKKLEKLQKETPEIIDKLAIGEGVRAVGLARKIATKGSPKIVNTGKYMWGFHAGDKDSGFEGKKDHDGSKPKRKGDLVLVDFYNNTKYASYLEYGFRSHFVPGEWHGYVFEHIEGAKGGMYVGPRDGYVQGHYALRRAMSQTLGNQQARLNKKLAKEIRKRMDD